MIKKLLKKHNLFSFKAILAIIAAAGALIYAMIFLYVYINQRSLMYHPEREKYGLAHYAISNTEEIFITTTDGVKLQAWFRKPDNGCDMTIFLHGNAGSLDDRADKLKQLADMGYGFVIAAWRGFGESAGHPSKEGLYSDARAVINFAQAQGYKPEDVVMIGESLGTGIATRMANEKRFKGLFLITPYTTIADRARELYPLLPTQSLTNDNYNNIDGVAGIMQPLLIIHGTSDTIVPIQHAEKVYAAALEPKKLIIYPGIGHTNYDKKAVFSEMRDFFGMCTKGGHDFPN